MATSNRYQDASSQINQLLDKVSPFRNGEMEQQGAKRIYEHENPLLGVVMDNIDREYTIALGCEHWAPNGVCRYRCDDWLLAVAGPSGTEE